MGEAPRGSSRPPQGGEGARFDELRARLAALRYDLPLGLESAPLVESLLSDLTKTNERLEALTAQVEAQAQSLVVAENTAHPLRKENGRLLRENNQLHLELITRAEQAERSVNEQKEASARLAKRNSELSFVHSQQTARIRALEEANAGLRERFNEALQQNGVVLPSGHEVRWHGRKEHMQAHSPVTAATFEGGETAAAPSSAPAADVSGLLETSERQVSHLQLRLDELGEKVSTLQAELEASRAAVRSREEEISRLSKQLETGRDFEKLSLLHVDQSRKEAIAQLNDQVTPTPV